MFKRLMNRLAPEAQPEIHVDSASPGPPFIEHDPRVFRLSRKAGLTLEPKSQKCFDEIQDMVNYDLVLVMDKFDQEEVQLCS